MEILTLDSAGDQTPVIERAAGVVRNGGTIVFPTDTLYGLGCNALDPTATGHIFDIKHRNYGQALPVLVHDLAWARELARITPEQEQLIARFWPGKVMFVLPRLPIVPAMTCGGGQTVGLRAPDHSFLQALLRCVGYPLIGTSANISGTEPIDDGLRIAELFGASMPQPDVIIHAGTLRPSLPSTVVDLCGSRPRIVRQGAVRADEILKLL